MAASNSAQRSVGGPLPGQVATGAVPVGGVDGRRPGRCGAPPAAERVKRRQSPSSDHTATAVKPTDPVVASTSARHAGWRCRSVAVRASTD